jgi:hypothetical protein
MEMGFQPVLLMAESKEKAQQARCLFYDGSSLGAIFLNIMIRNIVINFLTRLNLVSSITRPLA